MATADRRSELQSPRTPTRRQVLTTTAVAATGALLTPHVSIAQVGSDERIVIGLMGAGGRGTSVAAGFAALPNVVVKYACDVDPKRAETAAGTIGKKVPEGALKPVPLADFRRMLDDKDVTAIAIATPNHWHAPAAILAASAGKHVYVEKPCSHNPREGELLVEAARKHNRCIQHGTQRRSWAKIIEAMDKVKSGAIGPVRIARCWYTNARKTIGKGMPAAPPAGLDWALWQGPAPAKEFRDNYLHYTWHWFWHWGNGECGNNGVHGLDLGRWGLGVDCPKTVTSSGGRYYFDDDQETPDTQWTTFDYGDKLLTWEGKSCHPRGVEASLSGFGVAFYGEQGTIVLDSSGYTTYDPKNKEVAVVKPGKGEAGEDLHFNNFLAAIRANDPKKLTAEVAEAASSSLLCHVANIAQRTGRTIHLDPQTKQLKTDDAEAKKLWSREYQKGWEPKV
ncbi:MAG TPA: Gfo/Idh/MocA family oxidoreductase [Tepidisphaeraceae bacterium]|nr:Gfo/Idh/MocA family oxidoreductase [Tepidisphaeraceae bacterium]